MKYRILILGIFLSNYIIGQENQTKDFFKEIKGFNVSEIFMLKKFKGIDDTIIYDKPEPLGFIGENYQRFYIHFISVIQNQNNNTEYLVYGMTKVKENICTFQGKLIINEAKIYIDQIFPPFKQGYFNGNYEFFENPRQSGSGTLKGKFKTDFFIDKNGELKYDFILCGADGFQNNQFEGEWINYKTHESKKCNWGDYRIPDSNNLDSGTAEFMVNDKYVNFGWSNYNNITRGKFEGEKLKKALMIEDKKWWNINE